MLPFTIAAERVVGYASILTASAPPSRRPNEGSAATPWTISHRSSPGGEDQPVVAASAPATSTSTFYTFLPELSTDASASYTAVSFLRLLEPPSSYPSKSSYKSLNRNGRNCFIYASSTVSPRSSDEGADLAQHNQVSMVERGGIRGCDLSFPATGPFDHFA